MKTDRIGLVILLASLTAMAAIAYMVFQYQYGQQLDNTRTQGVSMTRAISNIPIERLRESERGVMQVLRHSTSNDNFAYLSIVDPRGIAINDVAANGVLIPAPTLPDHPGNWMGEATYGSSGHSDHFIEFRAPLLENGELQGFVRLGYRYPQFGLSARQLPFLAAVSLPIFLLAPLFYFLVRVEVRPVRQASDAMEKMIAAEDFRQVTVSADGELSDFMSQFNEFVGAVGERIEKLQQDQKQQVMSTKLLTYRKNRVETVLETLPEAVLILDEGGSATFANQKLAAMFNVSQQAILEQPPQSWCDNHDILQLLAKYQTGGKHRSFTDTIRFNISDLNEQSIVTKTYPLFSPNKPASAIGTLIVFRDETQEALARQARTDFVAHLSHELKSPLNVLAMYSESLLSESGRSEEFRVEAANVIADEVSRLGTLINGLLSMTQIESGSLTPDRSLVKLQDLAKSAFEEAQHLARDKELSFRFDVPSEMNPVMVDKDLIRIAVTNLLSNAVKYNKPGGEVRLAVQEMEDAIQIRVSDTGMGVSDKDAGKIFEKFYRADDERVHNIGGHGLGLALAKQIVDLHHGSLSLEQDRDEGAEFIINLWKETTAVKQAI